MLPTLDGLTDGQGARTLRCVVGGALLTVPLALPAQSASVPTDTGLVPLTFSVPESPAFTFLGVSPAKVTRASSARDLGAALVNSTDSTGRVLTGVAINATLWTLLPDVKVDLTSYQTRRGAYALANTQLSLGSARVAGDTTGTDVALGLRTTLLDRSDPMASKAFVRSLTDALALCLASLTGPNVPAPSPPAGAKPPATTGEDPVLACAAKANDRLRQQWFRDYWNKPALSWGVGAGWRLPRSEVAALDPLGVSTWLASGYPMGTAGQLLGQLQYDHRNARGRTDATDVLTYGVRAVQGSTQHNVFLEAAGTRRLKTTPGVSRSNAQWSGGIEFQIVPSYWLSTGFGKRYTAQGQPDHVVLIANMRWGVSSKSRLRTLSAKSPGT